MSVANSTARLRLVGEGGGGLNPLGQIYYLQDVSYIFIFFGLLHYLNKAAYTA